MGVLPLRDYDRRDSATIKEKKRKKERGREGIDKWRAQKSYCLFSESRFIIFLFSTHLLLPFLPHDAKEGQRKKKKKRKRKPAERILPISPSINAVYT